MSDSDEELIPGTATCKLDVATGLPIVTEEDMEKGKKGGVMMLIAMGLVPRVIGVGIAVLIYNFTGTDYAARIQALNNIGGVNFDLQYLYIAIGLFSIYVHFANFYPMIFKQQFLPGSAGNLRSNMFFYKVHQIDEQVLPYVVMEEAGEVGEYNRANRALGHFVENGINVAINLLAAGLVFSLPVLILTFLYVKARSLYQMCYASGGYGKHVIPFMLQQVLLAPTIEGFVWITAWKMCQ